MATLDIINWSSRGSAVIAEAPYLSDMTQEEVTFDDSPAVQSDPMTGDMVLLRPSANCFIEVGADPTATTGSIPLLAADGWRKFTVKPGDIISVIAPPA